MYDPKSYWESRLSKNFNLKGVGHISFSERYNYWLYKRKKSCLEEIFADIPLSQKHVLDVGSGTGFFIDWFIRRNAIMTGIDITEISIEKLKQKYSCNFFVQDIAAENYSPDRKYEIINMWDVIYHIVDDDRFIRTLENIRNSLVPGGILLISDYYGLSSDKRIAEHVHARCLDTYHESLGKMGFVLQKLFPLYYWLNQRRFSGYDTNLGWLMYFLDNHFLTRVPSNNISVGVWKMIK